jgi:indolepyruvate ferredoxin oxidoreductase beta subunit
MKDKVTNILISGVGGQGILLASQIVAEAFVSADYDVKTSVALGMSQRVGSVCSHIRAGKKIYSPLISKGDAEIVIAMELLEIATWLGYLKRNGLVILLDRLIMSGIIKPSLYEYINNLKDLIRKNTRYLSKISDTEISNELNDIKTANMFMLGTLSCYLPIKEKHWLAAIKKIVPPNTKKLNLVAFKLGQRKSYKKIK